MTQNIYDNDTFFAGYSRLPRSVEGLDAAPEWPTLREMLPPLGERRVVDLGCGFGWFCRFAHAAGAAGVTGFDVSENMLKRARETSDGAIDYRRGDLETLALPSGSADLVYSSLALHYVEKLDRLMDVVREALAPGGRLVFSVEHPIFTAPAHPGWTRDADDRLAWPVSRYAEEGARSTDWLAKGVIKHHRTLATYLNLLLSRDFRLLRVEEWTATPADLAAHPDWAGADERPSFLLVSASR